MCLGWIGDGPILNLYNSPFEDAEQGSGIAGPAKDQIEEGIVTQKHSSLQNPTAADCFRIRTQRTHQTLAVTAAEHSRQSRAQSHHSRRASLGSYLSSQQLDLTGKRNFPRIIVKPEFIASEKLEPKLKEFYRKLANTFLRLEVIRRKKAERSE